MSAATQGSDEEFERAISVARLRLTRISPFFGTLALYARVIGTDGVPTAATDGKDIYVNPTFFASLPSDQRSSVLMHEVLHAALLHVTRRGGRDARLWNIAADVVVNGMIVFELALDLPADTIMIPELRQLSVVEVYHQLQTDPRWSTIVKRFGASQQDLLEPAESGEIGAARRNAIAEHWNAALRQAESVNRLRGRGKIPLGLQRELEYLSTARLNWRAYLWRFLVRTPTDFHEFDRRLIARGYYLESLKSETIRVAIAVDTSGSVANLELRAILSEVRGILAAYPDILVDLYYADSALHGPFPLTYGASIPPAIGGGGTDFRPFFAAMEAARTSGNGPAVCVYLTDGLGTFPLEAPEIPVLWVLIAGGINLQDVPFGEAIRLILEPDDQEAINGRA